MRSSGHLPFPRALCAVWLACLLLGGMQARIKAQVLVYRLEIGNNQGINYNTFNGGYFAAPVLGGTGSFLLTSKEDGLKFNASSDSGTLFTATNHGEKKSVISATTGTGTAAGAFVAFGSIGHTLHINTPTVSLSLAVAYTLSGMAVSADSESNSTTTAADGSLGSAGFSSIKFVLDENQTEQANRQGLSLSQTIDQLKLVLERQGYSEDTSSTTGSGSSSSGSSGTGSSNNGTGSGSSTDNGTGTSGSSGTDSSSSGTTGDSTGSTVDVTTTGT